MNPYDRPKSWSAARWAAAAVLTLIVLGSVAAAAGDTRDAAAGRHVYRGDQVRVFGGNVDVPADTVQHGNIVCIGGDVHIAGEVSGDVVVILGSLEVTGDVGGAVTTVMSRVDIDGASLEREFVNILGPATVRNTTVSRELVNVLGRLDYDSSSRVRGELVNISLGDWSPALLWLVFWLRLLHKVVIFVFLILVCAVIPERIRLMGDEAPVRYVAAFFVGILGYLGVLVLLGLLSVTVVGLPLALVAFYALKWAGVAAIFFAIGRRIGRSFGREMSLLGAVLVAFAIYLLITLAPTPLGWVGLLFAAVIRMFFFLLIEAPAVGLVILTLVGGRAYEDRPALRGPIPPVGVPPSPPPPSAPVGEGAEEAPHDPPSRDDSRPSDS